MLSRANVLVKKTLDEGRQGRLDPHLVVEIKKAFPDIVRI
jgi:hypothetical protein